MRNISTLAHYQISILKKKRRTHRYDHISLLRFRPGEVLQELVARRRGKGTSFGGKFTFHLPGKIFGFLLAFGRQELKRIFLHAQRYFCTL